ncbi:MAG: hypothetical protein F4X54_08180 [Chloroflexi bacterium]|nr:hypothetical protein [Chloroflexota bacterium]
MRISEEIAVNASPERAWQAVTDYPSRVVHSERVNGAEVIGGVLEPGAKIRLRIDRRAFTVTVASVCPPEYLETRFGIPVLFSGAHAYTVSGTAEGASVRIDGEFSGLLGSTLTRLMRSSASRDLRDELAAVKAASEAL